MASNGPRSRRSVPSGSHDDGLVAEGGVGDQLLVVLAAPRGATDADPHAGGHPLERRALQLLGVAEIEELAGSEVVLDRPRRARRAVGTDHGHVEAAVTGDGGRAEAVDVDAERDDPLAHGEVAERVQQHVAVERRVAQRDDGVGRAGAPVARVGEARRSSSGSGSAAGSSAGGSSSPIVRSKEIDVENHHSSSVALPRARHGDGPESVRSSVTPSSVLPCHFTVTLACRSTMNENGENVNRASKPRLPVDAEPGRLEQHVQAGADLGGVGRDRQVRLQRQLGRAALAEPDDDAGQLREPGGRVELGVQAADRQGEGRVVAVAGPHAPCRR